VVPDSYSKTAPDVAGCAMLGAEEYGGVVAFESHNRDDHYSRYLLRAPDGAVYRLVVERLIDRDGESPAEG
jgi:hypothetical protein